ncbi:MAG: tRNA (5-methylaminomethyl-2-thiouridine)(34)-methyltransferase MnmD [Spirochaetales bacterium]|nr:tRNA (5-methylaminomethyl-2-thiouridine)(34)-methyltransferase MnmD [Spirochaetales bacterium]
MEENKNPHYDDLYFSEKDGMDESRYIFIEGNNLPERLTHQRAISIGETGFGTGLNFLTLLNTLQNYPGEDFTLHYLCLEKYPLPYERIEALLSPFAPRLSSLLPLYKKCWTQLYAELKPGWNRVRWEFPGAQVRFELYYGEALAWSRETNQPQADAWFLDGHSPDKNPGIWAPEIMKAVYDRTAPEGTLASFTSAGMVKRALREAGFFIKRKKGFGQKRHMIQGWKLS